ncbi:hypothetical protein [Saccharomonospora xinjiangensis]|uniref:Uncharacterized protein n=1 Tax=Saccharomonospora xinjiangensis XJ-54 TaxID=882086 RepID=I0V4I3_9PSEU|nr:hypothetical protein [Saccharomonospora xinjiangensis]EID55036.1 hypothetical protein SacxiDRAFT_2818 [Saccharomonospora xinjiangensis XJ-54]
MQRQYTGTAGQGTTRPPTALQQLWDLDFGRQIHLSDEQAERVRAVHRIRDHEEKEAARQALKERYGVESLSLGLSDGSYYLTGPRDGRAFYERACEIITDYRVGEVRNWPPPWEFGDNDDYDEDEYADKLEQMTLDEYPYAEFTLTVKDPRHVEHLGGGIHVGAAIHGEFGW